jgi:hypothetical protein
MFNTGGMYCLHIRRVSQSGTKKWHTPCSTLEECTASISEEYANQEPKSGTLQKTIVVIKMRLKY